MEITGALFQCLFAQEGIFKPAGLEFMTAGALLIVAFCDSITTEAKMVRRINKQLVTHPTCKLILLKTEHLTHED